MESEEPKETNENDKPITGPMDLYELIESVPDIISRSLQDERFRVDIRPHGRPSDPSIRDEYYQASLARVYKVSRQEALKLRAKNSALPPLPKSEQDAAIGLQSIQEWCIDAAKKPAAKRAGRKTKTKKAKTKAGTTRPPQKPPRDLITLDVAITDYEVSRSTLQRKIHEGSLTSHRDKHLPQNSRHLIRRADIEPYYRRRLK